jgi:hypothetical protein
VLAKLAARGFSSFTRPQSRAWYLSHSFRRVPNSLKEKVPIILKSDAPSFHFPSKKLTHLGCFANLDFIAEFFDSARQALRGSLLIDACKIECSEIAIRHLIAQQIIGDGKD